MMGEALALVMSIFFATVIGVLLISAGSAIAAEACTGSHEDAVLRRFGGILFWTGIAMVVVAFGALLVLGG